MSMITNISLQTCICIPTYYNAVMIMDLYMDFGALHLKGIMEFLVLTKQTKDALKHSS